MHFAQHASSLRALLGTHSQPKTNHELSGPCLSPSGSLPPAKVRYSLLWIPELSVFLLLTNDHLQHAPPFSSSVPTD